MEETGLCVVSKRPFLILKKTFTHNEFWFTCLVYICEAEGKLKPAEDEIEDARFLDPQSIIDNMDSQFTSRALEEFRKDPQLFRIIDLD